MAKDLCKESEQIGLKMSSENLRNGKVVDGRTKIEKIVN